MPKLVKKYLAVQKLWPKARRGLTQFDGRQPTAILKRMGKSGGQNKENLVVLCTFLGPGSLPKAQISSEPPPWGTLKFWWGNFSIFHFLARYCAITAALTSNLAEFYVKTSFIAQ